MKCIIQNVVILTVLVISTQTVSGLLPRFSCELEWVPMSVDMEDFPPSLVYATDNRIVVARAKPDNLFHTVGYVYLVDKIGHFPFEGQDKSSGLYEVATNPRNCILLWTAATPSEQHAVTDSEAGVHYIGRVARRHGSISSLTEYQSGPAFALDEEIIKDHMAGSAINRRWEVLSSFTEGFQVTITNFTLAEDIEDHKQLDFLGMDVIENRSPTTVKQTVTHRKRVSHSYHFEESYSYSHTWRSANFLTVILPFLYRRSGIESGGNSYEFDKRISNASTYEVVVSRSVVVPPYTSVEVCSTVEMVEGYKTDYIAKAEYVVPGWSDANVAAWLANEPDYEWVDTIQENGKTFRYVEGTLEIDSLSVQTEFVVVPKDSGGCSNLKRKIANARRLKRSKLIK